MFPNFLLERFFWRAKIAKILKLSHISVGFLQTYQSHIQSLYRIIVAYGKTEMSGKTNNLYYVVFS